MRNIIADGTSSILARVNKYSINDLLRTSVATQRCYDHPQLQGLPIKSIIIREEGPVVLLGGQVNIRVLACRELKK